MKKLALVLAGAALLAAPSLVSAQVTGSIGAQATVPTTLTFGTAVAIDFGSVAPGTTSGSQSGTVALTRNVPVSITLPDAAATGALKRVGGTEVIQPSWTACGTGAATTTTIGQTFKSCTPETPTEVVATLAAPSGTVTENVIFTGTVTVPTTAVGGTYTGAVRITATAN